MLDFKTGRVDFPGGHLAFRIAGVSEIAIWNSHRRCEEFLTLDELRALCRQYAGTKGEPNEPKAERGAALV